MGDGRGGDAGGEGGGDAGGDGGGEAAAVGGGGDGGGEGGGAEGDSGGGDAAAAAGGGGLAEELEGVADGGEAREGEEVGEGDLDAIFHLRNEMSECYSIISKDFQHQQYQKLPIFPVKLN